MRPIFPALLVLLAPTLARAAPVTPPVASPPLGRDAPTLYAEWCASCHGEHLDGGKGPRLTDAARWHAFDDATLARVIRDGSRTGEMPAFGGALNAAEIEALVVFLRESAARRREAVPQDNQPLPTGPLRSEEHAFTVEWVAEGFDVPWSMAFLPDGRMLVTERGGRLRIVENGMLRPETIGGLPPVVVKDEAGLLSVAVDPDYARNGWIYLAYCDPGARPETAMTKIVRARLRDGELVDREAIFSIPRDQYPKGYALFGCRLVFDGDYLFFGIGVRGSEAAVTRDAQDLAKTTGKIHRVFRDGRVPPDNPFVHAPGAAGSIWALGVRNPQGLARNPRDGALWESEHGPRGGDELNRIERGQNYGWPFVTRGINYDGTPISDKTDAPGLVSPAVNWTPSIAPSELEFYTGDRFPRWKGNLFMGTLATQKLLRFVIDGGRVVHTEEIFHHLGRVRDIKTGPDGYLYVALELIGRPGRIVRLKPAE
ncbi:MAG: PQQ-dependent sugar dehydrogenase [Opitutae bacterium]|nr:PQQ-dependent sugar dehydrogenase [Opitutae bacterium]